jgi:hypothetical protein
VGGAKPEHAALEGMAASWRRISKQPFNVTRSTSTGDERVKEWPIFGSMIRS